MQRIQRWFSAISALGGYARLVIIECACLEQFAIGDVPNNRHAADHFSRFEHMPPGSANHMFKTQTLRMGVILLRPGKLAKTDRHHLHEPAFEPAVERGVPLDACDDHHAIGRVRGRIYEDFDSIAGPAKRHYVWAADDRATHRLLGNSELPEHVSLSRCGRRTMTSHGGKNKWRDPVFAPGPARDLLAGLHPLLLCEVPA